MLTFNRSILLIDEPEAFLHPPQARSLGKFMARERKAGVQTFVATHSKDFIQGIMEARPTNLKFGRITRAGLGSSRVKWLESAKTEKFMSDTLLRVTSALDALFHSRVVLCEGDRDAVFYREILLALSDDPLQTDVLFLNTDGKDRMPAFVDALADLGLNAITIVDVDIIRSSNTLKRLLQVKGTTNIDNLLSKAARVKRFVEDKSLPVTAEKMQSQIGAAFASVSDARKPVPPPVISAIKEAIKDASSFSAIKQVGWKALPSGDAQRLYKELSAELTLLNVWIVPEGELEGFYRPGGPKGPKWLESALSRDLAADPDLREARAFISNVFKLKRATDPRSSVPVA